MKEPVLVVMAAGMGSRYGGLKQLMQMHVHLETLRMQALRILLDCINLYCNI